MSIKYMTGVWQNSKQTGTRLLILLAIADHANDEGIAWPGMTSLAKKARLKSRLSVLRAIQSICDDGELEIIEHNRNQRSAKSKSNRYKLNSSLLATSSSTATINSSSTATINSSSTATRIINESSVNRKTEKSTDNGFKTRDIQKAYEFCVPYKIDWVKGEGSAAKWLAESGYTPDDIKKCYAALKSQPFWKDKPLSLSSLKKQIGEWKQNGNHQSSDRVLEFTA